MTTDPYYDSARRPPPQIDEFVQLLRYRDLISQLMRRDIVTRYKRSALGVAWTMLNPLGMMLVLSIAFAQVFGATPAYPAYVLSGLIAWNFFGQTTIYAMRQLMWGGGLLHKIYLPKTVFAVTATGTHLINLLLALIPLFIVMIATGVMLQATLVFLPISILCLGAFTLGLSLLLSSVVVYFPDVAEMYNIILTAWMYLTPIIYPEEVIPLAWRWLLFDLNPMYHLIRLFRLPLYNGVLPSFADFLPPFAVALVMLIVGWVVFTRRADDLAYRV
jgi:ABC-type polysaccharide/polyol phosphate export permease